MPEIERPPRGVSGSPGRSVGATADGNPAGQLTARASRLCKLKKGNAIVAGYLERHAYEFAQAAQVRGACLRMRKCGLCLLLNEYLKTGETRLVSGHFCNLHMLCSLCAAGRAKHLIERFEPAVFSDPRRHSYMLTLTWPSGANLLPCLQVGLGALRKLWMRKKRKAQGPLRNVLGLIACVEITRGPKGWHPHLHCVITLDKPNRVDARELRAEWFKLTGGMQLDLAPIYDLREVFKYALKPGEMFPRHKTPSKSARNGLYAADRVEAWLQLRRKPLLRAYGIYRSLAAEPHDLTEAEEPGEFIQWLLLWIQRAETYHITKREGRHDLHPVQELPRMGKIEAAL